MSRRDWYKMSFFARFPEGVEPKTYSAEESLSIAGKLADAFGFEVIDSPVLVRLGDDENRLDAWRCSSKRQPDRQVDTGYQSNHGWSSNRTTP